jgi:YVTN family beta-propeller protein
MRPHGRDRNSEAWRRRLAVSCRLAALTTALIAHPALAAPFAYVAGRAGIVTVIDTAINEVVSQIETGFVSSVAVAAGGKRIYVAGANKISTLGGVTNTVMATVTVDQFLGIDRIAIGPDGKHAYIATSFPDASGPPAPNNLVVLIFDTATQTVTGRIDQSHSGSAGGMAVSQDGKHLYVGCEGKLFDIDPNTKTVTATVPLSNAAATGVAVASDQKRLYVSSLDKIFIIGTGNDALETTIPLPGANASGIAVGPDGRHAYVIGFNGVSVLDTASNGIVTVPLPNAGLTGIAITPDGKRAYIAANFSGRVSVLDTTTNIIIETFTFPTPNSVALMPAAVD